MRSASELEQLVSQRDGPVGPSALVLVEVRGCRVASDRMEGAEDIAKPVSTRRRDEFRPGSIVPIIRTTGVEKPTSRASLLYGSLLQMTRDVASETRG